MAGFQRVHDRPAVGARVGVDDPKYPGVWIVKSHGPKNATLTPENGGQGLRAPYYMLTDPTNVAPAPAVEYFEPGVVVRIPNDTGLHVVLADKGDRVNLAKLGGDNGRYLRHPRRGLVKVNVAEVLRNDHQQV